MTPEARGAFLANLGHEIRTPLHGVIAGADMLAQSDPPEDLRELIELVRSSSLTLEARLETLLDLVGRGQARATPIQPPGQAAASDTEQDWGSAPQILVADDHPANRRVVELVLGGLAAVRTVNDGREAVEAAALQAFDLILMDIQMPVLDGVSAVAEIRRRETARNGRRTPIAMLTANTDPVNVAASLAAGADRHIGKPFTAGVLLASVRDMLSPPAACFQGSLSLGI